MQSFTKKSTVTAVLEPIFEIARDMALLFEPPQGGWKNIHVADIRDGTITATNKPQNAHPEMPNHRRLKIAEMLSAKETDILAPLEQIMVHIPPLLPERSALRLRICRHAAPHFSLCLDGVEIWEGETLNSFVHTIYTFLRSHENLDMDAKLRPHSLIIPGEDAWQRYHLLADTAENALVRFAAINPELQTRIRRGDKVCCCPVRDRKEDFVVRALGGRVRETPAPAKAWVLD